MPAPVLEPEPESEPEPEPGPLRWPHQLHLPPILPRSQSVLLRAQRVPEVLLQMQQLQEQHRMRQMKLVGVVQQPWKLGTLTR